MAIFILISCSSVVSNIRMYALTCRDCPDITLGTPPSTVGGVNVTVVCRGGCQAFHSSTQGCEGLVVSLCGKAEQLLHKQDVAVCPNDTGPLKLYRCTRYSSGKGDLRCGGHCGNMRWGVQYYSKKGILLINLFICYVVTCNGCFNIRAHNSIKLKDLQWHLIDMPRS